MQTCVICVLFDNQPQNPLESVNILPSQPEGRNSIAEGFH